MLLEALAAFHERPSGGEEQNRNQYEENVQHCVHLCDAQKSYDMAVRSQGARQFFLLSPPHVPSSGKENRRARLQCEPETLHTVARQNYLRLNSQRAVAGQVHQLFHQVGVHQAGANKRHRVWQCMHGNQQNPGIQPRGQNRSSFQGRGGSFRPSEGDHQFQHPSGFGRSQTTWVNAKFAAYLHFFNLRVDP